MNDMILNMLANDSFTVSDFKAVGLTADNTKLESEDRYKQSEMIQQNDLFKDVNGNFDEELFHQYYLQATEFYNNLADETYIEDISKNTLYSKDNLFAPDGSKTIDETPKFVISPNPFLQDNSLTRVGKKGDRTLSIAEIAQSQKVYDYKEQKFKEESVNDRALGNNAFKWLGDLFSEPLVIAQWDEDGEHVDLLTGETKKHKKGDYKYNEEGTFYYETLGGRDVYGKQVLNKMNTLTVDGSAANAYDFFDSDDLQQKSIVGNVMKNMALVGSMFLPVVGNYIAFASIATQSVGLLGALGKMALGSDNETANTLHAWAKTVNRQSTSEYAAQNTWCWENLINMIGDTVGQLKEQRLLFTHVPALFKGTKGLKGQDTKTFETLKSELAKEIQEKTGGKLAAAIEKLKTGDQASWANLFQEAQELKSQHALMSQIKAAAELEKYMEGYRSLGSVLSKAYMTGITVQDTYGEAKANGASDLEAFALTLGYAAGEAVILNTGLGEWIMPELHGEKLKYRGIINALKQEIRPLSDNLENTATKAGKQNWFKQVFNIGKRLATDDYARQQFVKQTYNPMSVVLAHAGGEAFEELSEEVLADVSKTAFNTVNWLRGDETRMTGAWENVGDRYGMSLLGGFFGGGISSINTDFKQAQQLAKMSKETAMQEIVYMINNDKINDFLKFANKANIGKKNLTFETDEEGNFKAGTKENNQDKEIKDMLNKQVKLIQDTINAEGAKFSENSLFDALTLKDLRYLQLRNTKTAGLMFQEYNSLVAEMVELSNEIRKIRGDFSNTDTKKKELTESEAGQIAEYKKRLNELRVQKDAITSGKRSAEFIQTALYEASEALHGHKTGYQFQLWTEKQANKKFNELTNAEKETYREKYIAYKNTEMKNDVLGDARQFVDLVGLASGAIQSSQEYLDQILVSGKNDAIKIQTYLGNMLNAINLTYEQRDETFDPETFITEVQGELDKALFKTEFGQAAPLFTAETQARLDYINATEVDDVYTQDVKNMDKMSVILEAFADYADTITSKFIAQGYIHPEVKNHLVQTYEQTIKTLEDIKKQEAIYTNDSDFDTLSRLSAYLGKSYEEVQDLSLDGIRGALFGGYITNLKNKVQQIKELNHTPVVDLLEGFKAATSTSIFSVKDVLTKANELINQGSSDISEVTFGEDFGSQLQEVEEIIDLYASALYATRVDKSGVHNSWGYSKTLNELNKKYGNDTWVQLAEIDGEKADLIMQDLALIKQKLQFAKNLNSVNSGQKLNAQTRVGYNKQYIFFNKFEKLVNYLKKEPTKWNLESVYEAMSKIKVLKENNAVKKSDRKLSLTPEEKIQIEQESLMLYDAIHKFFEDNSILLTDENALAEFISVGKFDLYNPAVGLLTDQTEDLDDRQFIFDLAAKAALKGSFFYDKFRKTFNEEKAPVPMQESAIYLNVAMIYNGDVMNHFARAYAKSIFNHFTNASSDDERRDSLTRLGYKVGEIKAYLNNPQNFKLDSAVEKFANIVLTEGIAGSGKSGGVFNMTKKVINEINPELLKNTFFVHSTLKNSEKSLENLELTGTAFSSSNKEKEHDIVRYFYNDFTDEYAGKVKVVNGELQHSFTLKKDLTDLPKVIFIDEASRYDYVKMKLISEAAQHYGIAVLAAGDFDQISAKATIEIDKTTIDLAPNRLNFIGGSKLGLSFRTLNSQMSKNQKEVQANLHTEGKTMFNMYYWEDEKEIRGFKVYNDPNVDEVIESINKIKKLLKPDEKIGFLYANKDKSILSKIKEKFGDLIDDKTIDDAQGLEGKYYIIDLSQDGTDVSGKSEQELRDEFYTAFTRAEVGGLIISSNNHSQPIKVTGIKEETSELEYIPPKSIKSASKKRKDLFDKIFEDYEEEEFEYHPLTPVEIKPVVESSEESPSEEGIAPPLLGSAGTAGTVAPVIPEGMYKTREEAEGVDTSSYVPGLELLDKDDNLVGIIEGVSVQEHTDTSGTTYYFPAVNIKKPDGSIVALGLKELIDHKLKDPTTRKAIPKYKVGDVFYDADGKTVTVTEVIDGESIEYKVKKEDGSEASISEADLSTFSVTPPPAKAPDTESEDEDLGENDEGESYKKKLEKENGSNVQPRIESDGRIHHQLYTFNGYETGVLFDEDSKISQDHFMWEDEGNPIAQRTRARIDNVNGLIHLGAIDAATSKAECLDILAYIHNLLMNNTNNSDILKKLADKFSTSPQTFSTIEFGIKSSAMISSKNPDQLYGTSDEDAEWHVFDKHRDEVSEYSQPNVIEGDALNRTSVVAVFRDADGKKVLEITLGSLNSPITIGQRTDESGEYIYPEVGAILEALPPDPTGEQIFEACSECVKVCAEKGYTDLHNLFKAFLFTSNGYAPISARGSDFNLASKRTTGPVIVPKKGDYQKNTTRHYETRYVDLSEFVNDERVVVSDIWIPNSNTYGGKSYAHIHQGHPGVFVSYNKNYDPADLPRIYESQLESGTPGDVEFYYIIPPDATVAEYLRNFRHAYLNSVDGGTRAVLPIGNMWTAYKLLRNIYQGGELTESKLKSKLLDRIELTDLISLIDNLIAIENRTDWSGDEKYETLLSEYKSYYTNPEVAKKYAIRNTILAKQRELLTSNYAPLKMPVFKVFTSYIANAAYWTADASEAPNTDVLNLIEKYNKGTIKYKVRYNANSARNVGMFSPAKVSTTNKYALPTITTDGDLKDKEFVINAKIDPPVFEFDELTNAVGILAQWEYEDPNNTNSRKIAKKPLLDGTYGYKRNSKSTKKSKNNFEKLKDKNKILFGDTGLFKDIVVDRVDDPALDEEYFAREILKQFNSKPNNLGFAIKDKSGKIKMYAFKINEFPNEIARQEMETTQSLGGITIGKELIFTNVDSDIIQFSSENRDYNVSIEGNEIVFQHTTSESKPSRSIKITYNTEVVTKESFDEAQRMINETSDEALKSTFDLTFDQFLNLTDEDKLGYMMWLDLYPDLDFPASFRNHLTSTLGASVNVAVGDKVSLNEGSYDDVKTVKEIAGSLVTLNDDTVIDVSTNTLFKLDEMVTIDCVKQIRISYGK